MELLVEDGAKVTAKQKLYKLQPGGSGGSAPAPAPAPVSLDSGFYLACLNIISAFVITGELTYSFISALSVAVVESYIGRLVDCEPVDRDFVGVCRASDRQMFFKL